MKTVETLSDDTLLLADLKAGDSAAFKYFYDKYHIQLYRKLLKLVQIDVIAEELLQDLFLKIWQKRALIDVNQSFKAYLYRIAQNMVSDHFRKLAKEIKLERETDVSSLTIIDTPDDFLQGERAQEIINEAISVLPAQQQLVFRMCKIEGKSYEEVSKLLNISHATINTHISRASKTVKTYILKNHGNTMNLIGAYAVLEVARQLI